MVLLRPKYFSLILLLFWFDWLPSHISRTFENLTVGINAAISSEDVYPINERNAPGDLGFVLNIRV